MDLTQIFRAVRHSAPPYIRGLIYRAVSHLTRRLISSPCSCYRRSLPRTSQVAQVRPRVSTITKGGLRSHLTCQENFRAQSRSRTSPTLPKRWEREPSSAVWKG